MKLKNALSPSQSIILGFAFIIFVGMLLLMLPISSNDNTVTHWLDALFTATSAVCVTGQVTLNTSVHWSYFGKTVIITLIEIGGLGFMSIIAMTFMLLRRTTSVKNDLMILESLNINNLSNSKQLLFYIIRFSLTVQLMGALLLSVDFIPRFGWGAGIYYAVFHSISAFCNAGFDLFGDSLISFQDNHYVILVIASLIFIGSLGFIVCKDLMTYRKNRRLLFHSRVILMMVGLIVLISFISVFLIGEHNHLFDHLSLGDRLANYLFMVITPRTAGYASVDYSQLSLPLIMITLILMYIGASSGSTGGGLKVTTLFVLIVAVLRSIENKDVTVFKRTLTKETVSRSFQLFFLSFFLITTVSFILLITEEVPVGFGIEYILMEVISCFSTVGLTLGLTPHLSGIGKVLLISLMFIGRVGLSTFFWSFGHNSESKIHLPEGKLMIG